MLIDFGHFLDRQTVSSEEFSEFSLVLSSVWFSLMMDFIGVDQVHDTPRCLTAPRSSKTKYVRARAELRCHGHP